ncbi:uncharacterized protein L201_008116 [Kwoniella dendrophila CBS 6074]|uniref:Uncharacterized protein n=1 Tax=Kwoniella dendrophila CBS 6074 TaxID=1295534 RepID=A0AAX4K705_9TREE
MSQAKEVPTLSTSQTEDNDYDGGYCPMHVHPSPLYKYDASSWGTAYKTIVENQKYEFQITCNDLHAVEYARRKGWLDENGQPSVLLSNGSKQNQVSKEVKISDNTTESIVRSSRANLPRIDTTMSSVDSEPSTSSGSSSGMKRHSHGTPKELQARRLHQITGTHYFA